VPQLDHFSIFGTEIFLKWVCSMQLFW